MKERYHKWYHSATRVLRSHYRHYNPIEQEIRGRRISKIRYMGPPNYYLLSFRDGKALILTPEMMFDAHSMVLACADKPSEMPTRSHLMKTHRKWYKDYKGRRM